MSMIHFHSVSKQFTKGKKLLKEALVDTLRFNPTETFWALKDVNFELHKGEVLGLVGPNGSGKSTALKLMAGVMVPTKGEVTIEGKIAPLIELGAGFHFELTGRENIYINGSILGLRKRAIEERIDEIIAFAELEEFIDTPIKHYSSGMFMRLGFSVAIHVEPEILLVDEILAVGDAPFQKKCFAKMEEFKAQKITMVIVSHERSQLSQFCDKGLYLLHGQQQFFGAIDEALASYQEDIDHGRI